MSTELREVYDFFMMKITDYRLDTLYNTSDTAFEDYLQLWLDMAIVEFSMCDQSLAYNNETKVFDELLTSQNKVMLATLMVKYWLKKNVNDITQMNLHVTDRDFKVASEAMNLREKKDYLIVVTEESDLLLNSYAYARNNWDDWYSQLFV